MSQMLRTAVKDDVSSIVRIYDAILDREEEAEEKLIGWVRGIYPTEQTAEDALRKGTLFVYEENGEIVAAAKIDQEQVCEYADCHWEFDAPDNERMVMHTLVVDPQCSKKGYGKSFLDFYEEYAVKNGCGYLRIDTNEKNAVARSMYKRNGYNEVGIVPCSFNGIKGVNLVCLEKRIQYDR